MLNNNKRVITFLVLSIFTLLLCLVIVWFLYQAVKEESNSVKAAETSIAVLEKKTQDLAYAKESLGRLGETISLVDGSFLSEERFVVFVERLEEVARTAGVELQVNNAQLPAGSSGSMRVSLDASGSFESLARFVALLDHMPYPSIVVNATIVQAIAGNTEKIRMSLRFDVFNFRNI